VETEIEVFDEFIKNTVVKKREGYGLLEKLKKDYASLLKMCTGNKKLLC
jgi:hypothetical protein